MKKQKIGRWGEKKAALYLRRCKNYLIWAKNVRFPVGEIDLIAIDSDTLVFVEVKTRKEDVSALSSGLNAVNKEKERRLDSARYSFVRKNRMQINRLRLSKERFEIIEIVYRDGWLRRKVIRVRSSVSRSTVDLMQP